MKKDEMSVLVTILIQKKYKFDGIASCSIEIFWFLTISIVEVKNVHFKSFLNLFKMIKYKFDSVCVQETAEEMYKL